MIIRQEENTPIGDYFHDSGICKVFDKLQELVDEFEVDTDDLNGYCDAVINLTKNLKAQIKKVELALQKQKQQDKIKDFTNSDW